jgi:hypothetical protein
MDSYIPYYVTYRAKSIKTNKWVYGDLIHGNSKNHYQDMIYTEDCEMVPIDRLTVTQSTCLTDINAHNIFIGDYVKIRWDDLPLSEQIGDGTDTYHNVYGIIVICNFKIKLEVIRFDDKVLPEKIYFDIIEIPNYVMTRTYQVINNNIDDPIFKSKILDGKVS